MLQSVAALSLLQAEIDVVMGQNQSRQNQNFNCFETCTPLSFDTTDQTHQVASGWITACALHNPASSHCIMT